MNLKTFSPFLSICRKCFTKRSCLVCFVYLSDIKSNWSPAIKLIYPVQFFPSLLLFVLKMIYQGGAAVCNTIILI